MDPLIDPRYLAQDIFWERTFSAAGASGLVSEKGGGDDQVQRDHVRGIKRLQTFALDWAGDKILLSTKESPGIRLIDPEKGQEERSWGGEWMSIQVDPNDPNVAAAISWKGKFKIFDTRSAEKFIFDTDLSKTSPQMKEFLVLRWSPDSRQIALNNRSDQVYLMDRRSHDTFVLGGSKSLQAEVNQMAWSSDGKQLWIAAGGNPGRINVLPVPFTEAAGTSLTAHQTTAICLAADPTGRHIASGGSDCLVTLWDPKHLVCTRTFGYATQAVTNVDFNHTGSLLAWCCGSSTSGTGGEKNITIVGADTGTHYWNDPTPAPVQQVRWHPKRNVLAYTLNSLQLPDERENRDRYPRGGGSRDSSILHLLKVPERA